jgi:hypothetical protein
VRPESVSKMFISTQHYSSVLSPSGNSEKLNNGQDSSPVSEYAIAARALTSQRAKEHSHSLGTTRPHSQRLRSAAVPWTWKGTEKHIGMKKHIGTEKHIEMEKHIGIEKHIRPEKHINKMTIARGQRFLPYCKTWQLRNTRRRSLAEMIQLKTGPGYAFRLRGIGQV